MARALQCPACSTRHAIDGVAPGATFSCTGCGRTLRAPGAAVAATPTATGASGSPTRAERRRGTPSAAPSGFPLAVRIVAWIVSVLVGGAVSLWIARAIGLLSTDNLIDVITGSGSGRYLRMALWLPIWALVTAGLVTLLLDGGWRLMRRAAADRGGQGPTRATPARRAPAPADAVPASARTATGVPDRGAAQRPRRIPPRDTGA